MTKKRFVLVGAGARSFMFSDSLLTTYRSSCELAAICDVNPKRMEYHNNVYRERFRSDPVRMYLADDFERMIAEQKPDAVIVASVDCTHEQFIIKAMQLGCDVISEKPLTTNAASCRRILEAVKSTGRSLRVSFNYRYAPATSTLKKLLQQEVIGKVNSIHFEWLLDTRHGADYYRRWHRDKTNSGGLIIHKASHHFDLLNWWLESEPELVFGLGSLAFYGKTNAEQRGAFRPYRRSTDDPSAAGDPFALNLRDAGNLQGLYLEAECEDGYLRDQNVFGENISIEDTMNLAVRYRNGTQLSYSLTSYSPWEGFRVALNGTKGRIQLEETHNSYITAGNSHISDGLSQSQQLTVFPHWEKPYHVEIPEAAGGHGGGDQLMLQDLFGDSPTEDPLRRVAGPMDGVYAVLIGVAANESFSSGLPVRIVPLC